MPNQFNPEDVIMYEGRYANLESYFLTCFQGDPPRDNWLMLPHGIELNKKYIVLLYEESPGRYSPVSRKSLFIQGSKEYQEFFTAWENR